MSDASVALLELQYLPPIRYFSLFLRYKRVRLEQHEHYHKGSYRNRCHIAAPNGLQRLSIPLRKGKNQRQPIREVGLSYDEPWHRQHWHALETAYNSSPFFEYYAPSLEPFYLRRYDLLSDFNLDLLRTVLDLLGLPATLEWTDAYDPSPSLPVTDWRDAISPKPDRSREDPGFRPPVYHQVFEQKMASPQT